MNTSQRLNGTVKWFNVQKGYGFITPDGQDKDVFVHASQVQESGMSTLQENQRISFEMITDRKNKSSAGKLQAIQE